jgi:CrcB protein
MHPASDPHASRTRFARDLRLGAVIAAGGAVGALVRWALGEAYPATPGAFPASTFAINVVGCALIGALMVVIEEALRGRVYVRPFLGVGFLGGFTTFSTFAVETHDLIDEHVALAALYFLATPAAAILAVIVGAAAASSALRLRASSPPRRSRP